MWGENECHVQQWAGRADAGQMVKKTGQNSSAELFLKLFVCN